MKVSLEWIRESGKNGGQEGNSAMKNRETGCEIMGWGFSFLMILFKMKESVACLNTDENKPMGREKAAAE